MEWFNDRDVRASNSWQSVSPTCLRSREVFPYRKAILRVFPTVHREQTEKREKYNSR
jgi:hypothetical protein